MPILEKISSWFKKDSEPLVTVPRMPPRRNVPSPFHSDASWENALTNLGVKGKDKRMSAVSTPFALTVGDLDISYQSDDIVGRIIDRIPEEMFREGFKICLEDGDNSDKETEAIQAEFDRHGVSQKMEFGEKWARLYGGAGIYIGVDDGLSPEEPLDLNRINAVTHLVLLDRYELVSAGGLDKDVRSQNFAKPEYYRISTNTPTTTETVRIHNSRIIRFEGSPLPRRLASFFDYWGQSILNRIYLVIMNFNTSNDAIASIVQDFSTLVMKMQELSNIIAMGNKGDEILQKRLDLAAMARSTINALIIRPDEEIEEKGRQVTGLADLMRLISARLVAATDLPHTILLGESPSGLGATGDSEITHFYDHIKSLQKSRAEPIIRRLIDVFQAAKNGPFGGEMREFTVHFNPLWQLSEKEQAEVRQIQSNTDKNYYDIGALYPDEIAMSRFGSGKYSTDTQLDFPMRERLDKEAPDTSLPTAYGNQAQGQESVPPAPAMMGTEPKQEESPEMMAGAVGANGEE